MNFLCAFFEAMFNCLIRSLSVQYHINLRASQSNPTGGRGQTTATAAGATRATPPPPTTTGGPSTTTSTTAGGTSTSRSTSRGGADRSAGRTWAGGRPPDTGSSTSTSSTDTTVRTRELFRLKNEKRQRKGGLVLTYSFVRYAERLTAERYPHSPSTFSPPILYPRSPPPHRTPRAVVASSFPRKSSR